jgi:hypothetical protein
MAFPRIGTLLEFGSAPPISFGWATADDTFGSAIGQDITASYPSNVEVDDIVIAAVASDFQHEWGIPTGFASLGGTTASLGARLRWWWRRYDGSEGATFMIDMTTTSDAHRAWRVIRIPLAHTTQSPPTSSCVFGTGATVDPGSISPSWGTSSDSLILVAGAVRGGQTNPMITSYSTNYENGIEHGSYGGGASHVLFMESRIVNAASEDPGVINLAEDRSRVACVTAIRAA